METEFYLISDLNRIGKIENYIPYLYDTGKGWMVDSDNIVMDRLMGYNGESIGATDALLKIEEISEAEAESRIKRLRV
ncbi:hypothetical protein QBE55_03445 [Eubacteriales bacterium mix99]